MSELGDKSSTPQEAGPLSACPPRLSRRCLTEWFARAGECSLWAWAALEAGFPMLPVEVLMVPLTRKAPGMARRFVIHASVFSAVGALYSYAVGHFAQGYLAWEDNSMTGNLFGLLINAVGQWGEGLVFLAAFLPLPLFVFAVAAGVLHIGLLPFLITVVISRALRFYLVTSLTVHFIRKDCTC